MDTRSLRLWSNQQLSLGFGLHRLTVVLAVLLALPGAALGSSVPVAFGSLIWNSDKLSLEGSLTYVFPEQASVLGSNEAQGSRGRPKNVERPKESIAKGDEFWLLPNRDLPVSPHAESSSRDQKEFRSADSDVEWPFQEIGLGALVVREVNQGAAVGMLTTRGRRECPTRALDAREYFKDTTLAASSFEVREKERVLWVAPLDANTALSSIRQVAAREGQKLKKRDSDHEICRLLRIRFVFYPRHGSGNFARRDDGDLTLSGPIFPLWRDRPIETHFTLTTQSGILKPSCVKCRETGPDGASLTFFGLPPPLHFLSQASPKPIQINQSERGIARVDLVRTDSQIHELRETLLSFQKRVEQPLLQNAKKGLPEWSFNISFGLPIEQLVVEQWGEIQLHPSFGHVTPFLANYHRAALFRALSRSFARYLLNQESKMTDWRQLQKNETLARVLAEIWLRNEFPKLSALKELSDTFSFLPFFRAIQQGNAFVNNSVFVGKEEAGSFIDYGIIDDVIAPFTGSEILERMNGCLNAVEQNQVKTIALDLSQGKASVDEFVAFMSSTQPRPDCGVPIEEGIIPGWTAREEIEIVEGTKKNLTVKRKIVSPSATHRFFYPAADGFQRDQLRLKMVSADKNFQTKVLEPEKIEQSEISLPNDFESFEILEPHRALSAERLQYPRPIRTVLQALSLNYDSRRSDATIKSQLLTTQMGDEWGKTLLLGLRREEQKNHLDLQISTGIPSLIKEMRSTIAAASTTRMAEAPPTYLSVSYSLDKGIGSPLYPDGIGLKLWLRRPITLSAFREKMTEPEQEWLFAIAVPLAPRLTWSENVGYARSESGIDAGLRSIPGWPAETFRSSEYVVIRSELRKTLTQNLNASIARSVLFQHAILYAAHSIAFDDLQAARQGSVDARSAQSILAGIRLLGALFGAKDQSLSFEVARAMVARPRTSFGFTLGKTN